VMTSSGHALGHVTNTEKMQRLPGKLLYRSGIFFIDSIFNFDPHNAMHRFCFISTRSDLREFQNIEKFIIF